MNVQDMGFVFYSKYTTEQKDIEIHRNNESGVLILKVLQNSELYLHGSNLLGGVTGVCKAIWDFGIPVEIGILIKQL